MTEHEKALQDALAYLARDWRERKVWPALALAVRPEGGKLVLAMTALAPEMTPEKALVCLKACVRDLEAGSVVTINPGQPLPDETQPCEGLAEAFPPDYGGEG